MAWREPADLDADGLAGATTSFEKLIKRRRGVHHRSSRIPLKNGCRTLPWADFALYSISVSSSGTPNRAVRDLVGVGLRLAYQRGQEAREGKESGQKIQRRPRGEDREGKKENGGLQAAKLATSSLTSPAGRGRLTGASCGAS